NFCCATAGKGEASAANMAAAPAVMARRLVKGDAKNFCISISLGFPRCFISGLSPVTAQTVAKGARPAMKLLRRPVPERFQKPLFNNVHAFIGCRLAASNMPARRASVTLLHPGD